MTVRKSLDRLLGGKLINISTCLNLEALNAIIAAILVEVENSRRLKELMELFKDYSRTIMSGLNASNLLTIIMGENISTLGRIIGICSFRTQTG
ncbi:MAG: hypothetical protein ACUVTM_05645 [Candidatus Bathyarchaeia archaeon]